MTNIEIEKRLEIVEAEIAVLKSKVEKKDETTALPWWKQIVGTFADDPAHEEAMRLGREYREAQKDFEDEG